MSVEPSSVGGGLFGQTDPMTAASSAAVMAAAAAASANSPFLSSSTSSTNSLQAEAARQFLHQLSASQALNPPPQVELKASSVSKADLGVWSVEIIPPGTRFGPFLGKWVVEPTNGKYAWEVSQ
jgi:hypothetical protein